MVNVKCKSCVNLREHWCNKIVDSPCEDLIRDCQFYKAKTNGDVVRAMTDEELADWFGSSEAFCPTGYYETSECDACVENCIKHWLSWLKQEVEE